MSHKSIENILTKADDKDFSNCGGYLILGHQIQSLLEHNEESHSMLKEQLDRLEETSNQEDKKIIDKLDGLQRSMSENKEDGNRRALNTEKRLVKLETEVGGISDSMKWLIRTVLFGIFLFFIQQIGLISYIKGLF
jgi:uncharacterized protein HemX